MKKYLLIILISFLSINNFAKAKIYVNDYYDIFKKYNLSDEYNFQNITSICLEQYKTNNTKIYKNDKGEEIIELENEKMMFSAYAINNLSGNLQREMGYSFDYYTLMLIDNPKGNFKNCKVNFVTDHCGVDTSKILNRITVTGDSLEEIILSGKQYDLKYILSNEKPDDIGFHEFLDEIYFTDKNYDYLTKIFDSNDHGYKKLKFKIYEIDYNKFEEVFVEKQLNE